jgi:hypothetical protein
MRTMMRYGVILVAALASAPAFGAGMTKDEPTPPAASEAKRDEGEAPAAGGSRVSGNMLKDDQDAARADAGKRKAKKAPAAKGRDAGHGRVSGNMYQGDQDAARAAADGGAR